MLSSPPSLVFKRNVHNHVWQQLAELWLDMATQEETQLFTENTLIELLKNETEKRVLQQIETDQFFLLITPSFNVLLHREKNLAAPIYQVSVIFDSAVITDKLIQFCYEQKWNISIIERLRTNLTAKLTTNTNSTTDFILKAVKLLINSAEPTDRDPSQYSSPQMENLLHYQVEQEKIFEQIKIQIAQNLNLPEIIQTAINRSCDFLKSDRLLVYQLGVSLKSGQMNIKPVKTVDTITHEARSSEDIVSTLYLQEIGCWDKASSCSKKYRQGFGLVINDLTVDSHLDLCLQSLMNKLQVKAKVVIPINIKSKLWGLIIAHQCEPRAWQHQEVQFLRQVAEYLAIAIFNHQSYQQLQQQKKLLEKQVETQSQQLKDALIAAEAASKSKHDFLGSMSHELRTPLTCVIGLSSTLLQWSSTKQKMHLSPEKQHEYLHLIQQSGKHLLSLINNILEFSDVESGKHLLEIKQVVLPEAVKHTLHLLQETAEAKNIKLRSEIKIEPEKTVFFADEIRLKEILFHILSNGIKFTPQGGEVILRVWREQRQVIFQIEDTGIGIAPEEIPLLFEKFKQIENVRQRVHGGTGLGLALTKKLVELHGGTIEIESALGEGSIFTVYLPERELSNQNLHSLAPTTHIPQTASGSQTIVLVTEDEASATFICQLLNTIDYQVVWLMDSAMVVNQIELLRPRIVIIDQDCSMMDVQHIVNAIAHASLADYTKVSLLGDRFEHDEWQKFTKCGVDEYLLKSMNPTQIINKINNLSQKEDCRNQLQDG
ncbi:hybrid sensor histidine kinase/response regulator [Pleurocapsa sp. CCALA 161]|uniref:hybrid sensor histidine kinase/response regulator n=1 Tax=Pleurocapsa sp. CCALA 161 TaxID=2107688 RepID=UPI000D0644C9|nr:GAF domain-containing sensor histidine kinase [Pleurocapsa sp. CCALA 161]PSB07820.1 hybrid sensor histidine kinase/response regulator [Pleurocapsa sp. CCALA 161]